MKKIKVGFLPLYVKLYDDVLPDVKKGLMPFVEQAMGQLEAQGFELVKAPVCRLEAEFQSAVDSFNTADVDAIVTLHLAYSPSLESITPLLSANAPIIVMDSTPVYDYARQQSAANIMANHGIHGVQDMTCLLRKHGKTYFVEAGHLDHSDVALRVGALVRASAAAKTLSGLRVGTVGEPFQGMGDFRITAEQLFSDFGITLVEYDFSKSEQLKASITQKMIDDEIASDKEKYLVEAEVDEDYIESTRTNLMIRKWAQDNKLSALTFNFLGITKSSGIPRVPFMEACKAMERGLGYAGEGDTLTASIVGALASAFPEASFCEMFCPSWEDDIIFLSHMGEMNTALCAEQPKLKKMKFIYTDAGDPVYLSGRYKAGKAVYFNLTPNAGGGFDMIIFPIEMLNIGTSRKMEGKVEGWFKTEMPINTFLKKYSEAGGTHHAGFVYNTSVDSMVAFAKLIGVTPVVL